MRNYISGVELLSRSTDFLKFRVMKSGVRLDVSMVYLEGFDNCDDFKKTVTFGECSITKMFKIKDFVVKTTISPKDDFDDLYSYGDFLQQVEIYDLEYHVALLDSINCVYGKDTDSPVFGEVIAYCRNVLTFVFNRDVLGALPDMIYFSSMSIDKEEAPEYKGEITLMPGACVTCVPEAEECFTCPHYSERKKITNISAVRFYEYKDSDDVYKVSSEQAVNGKRVKIEVKSEDQFAAELLYEFALWYSNIDEDSAYPNQ